MSNPFSSAATNLAGLARDVIPVTASDTADVALSTVALGITCKGAAGNVVITTAAGVDRTYPISQDEVLPVGVSRVKATGTTATGIWAFIA